MPSAAGNRHSYDRISAGGYRNALPLVTFQTLTFLVSLTKLAKSVIDTPSSPAGSIEPVGSFPTYR